VKDEEGELYFATKDTRLRHLGATAVAAEFVNRRMSRSRCRRIVLLPVSAVGAGLVRLARRPAPYSWITAVAGIIGAVALYIEQQNADWFNATPHLAGVTWTSVAALVIPVAAAMTLPHRFAIALLTGWLTSALSILALNAMTGTMVFDAALVALVIALALLIRTERRSHPPT
jgi:hypothetical protein